MKGNIIRPDTINPYIYCLSNPLKYVDFDGNETSSNSFYDRLNQSIQGKIILTIHEFIMSFEAEAGIGTGFFGSLNLFGLGLSGGARLDVFHMKISADGVDIGEEQLIGVSGGVDWLPFLSIDAQKGYFHSYFCDEGNQSHIGDGCPRAEQYDEVTQNITILESGGYMFLGFNFSISFNFERFYEKFAYIWSDAMEVHMKQYLKENNKLECDQLC